MIDVEKIADIELCKKLREEGYSKPTEYFWQDKDLPYLPAGLRKMKEGKKINHNNYDDFLFSAPTKQEAVEWLIGKKMFYESSTVMLLNKKSEINKNDYAHMHDCVLDLTWNTTKTKLSNDEIDLLFQELPSELKSDAMEWGMSDTLWREKFMEWYQENKI